MVLANLTLFPLNTHLTRSHSSIRSSHFSLSTHTSQALVCYTQLTLFTLNTMLTESTGTGSACAVILK